MRKNNEKINQKKDLSDIFDSRFSGFCGRNNLVYKKWWRLFSVYIF